MKRKGFTLIELLAVIVILAIIALISTPIIIGVIEKARKGAFEDSAYGVLDAGKLYYIGKLADENKFGGATFKFPEGGDLKISGEKPGGGVIILDSDGKQAIALHDKEKKWCALKGYDDEKITIKDYKEEECKVFIPSPAEEIIREHIGEVTTTEGCGGTGLLTDLGTYGIRYQGNCPNNFVTFNDERAGWRILGIIDGKVKLLRNEKIGKYAWDNKDTSTGAESSTGKNDWSSARLMKLLNPGYEGESIGGSLYWNSQEGTCYGGFGNATLGCSFKENGLTGLAQNMIADATWYLGGGLDFDVTRRQMYKIERGNVTTAGRPKSWIGKVGLAYPSDMGFTAEIEKNCTEDVLMHQYNINMQCMNKWFFKERNDYDDTEWTITPSSSNSYPSYIYIVSKTRGALRDHSAAGNKAAIRPSVYLKSEVKIIGGDGTKEKPYQLSL